MIDREINLMMPVFNGPDSICEQALSIYPDKLKTSYNPKMLQELNQPLSSEFDPINQAAEKIRKALSDFENRELMRKFQCSNAVVIVDGRQLYGFGEDDTYVPKEFEKYEN